MRKHEEIAEAFAPTDALNDYTSFYLVGIGGAGMSALARMLKHRGYAVRGSDASESPETKRLVAEGISVRIGHTGQGLTVQDAVVLTDAIDLATSPEVAMAKELSIPIVRRSQALGWALRRNKVIAITGTHGKTTTTGMVGSALIEAGLDPTVVVGANIPQWEGPVREGKGPWAVVEACEAYDSFHDLDPQIVVLTNLEPDHLDFHGTYEALRDSVVRFVRRAGPTGSLIYCADDKGATEVANLAGIHATAYDHTTWTSAMGEEPGTPGNHNLMNAGAALSVLNEVGGDRLKGAAGVSSFHGAERRLQVLFGADDGPDGVMVIDDYAHHPTEISASLEAIRSRWAKDRRLIVVFQPHLYSRTKDNIAGFAEALSAADVVVITDIYPAREAPMPGVSSTLIAERISKLTYYIPCRHLLPREVLKLSKPGNVIVGMGAGNIQSFAPDLIREIKRSRSGKPLRIAVCGGGDSPEREVSKHSAIAIEAALSRLGHQPEVVDVSDLLLSTGDLSLFKGPDRPDLAFLAVHGTNSEDGGYQGLFELLHLPYTGSGVQASALAMDKAMTKRVLEANGIKVPRGVLLRHPDEPIPFDPPLIVKPNAQGSTVGLTFVETKDQLAGALQRAFTFEGGVLVEEWIRGVEISTPVLDDQPLLPVEILPTNGKYDFQSKYEPGATTEIVPARLPEDLLAKAQEIALASHRALGCAGATRTDAIIRDGEIFVLEVNTLPGMTGTSLLPNSAKACGISFDEVCQRLVEDALGRYAKRQA